MIKVVIMVLGILIALFGIIAIKKFPRIPLKRAFVIIIAGIVFFIIGLTLALRLPEKGLLSEGSSEVTKSDDAAGNPGEEEGKAEPGTIVITGTEIYIDGEKKENIAELDHYMASSGWKGGYMLIDKYAAYETYIEVKEFLEETGKEILSEEQRF